MRALSAELPDSLPLAESIDSAEGRLMISWSHTEEEACSEVRKCCASKVND